MYLDLTRNAVTLYKPPTLVGEAGSRVFLGLSGGFTPCRHLRPSSGRRGVLMGFPGCVDTSCVPSSRG